MLGWFVKNRSGLEDVLAGAVYPGGYQINMKGKRTGGLNLEPVTEIKLRMRMTLWFSIG